MLTEVQHVNAAYGFGDAEGRDLPIDPDRWLARRRELWCQRCANGHWLPCAVIESSTVPACLLAGEIVGFAVVEVTRSDRAFQRAFPKAVRAEYLTPTVAILDLQLQEKTGSPSIEGTQPTHEDLRQTDPARIVAVPQQSRGRVRSGLQQLGHVVGLILNVPRVLRELRLEQEVAHPLAVEPQFVEPQCLT